MVGRTLSHYRIVEVLGAGGMGVVYRARDLHLDRDVALKVLPPGSLGDETARRRFRKEALTLSRLKHPHIATVHDFDSQDGIDFLVMELVNGQQLSGRIAAGPLSETEIRDLGAQIAEALEAAHEQGVVHRDLKPANIVLDERNQVKVLDFGLAKQVNRSAGGDITQSVTEVGAVVGTLSYMSPEQLLGRPATARADLYSLGVVLYELAAGRLPWIETLPTALVYEIANVAPPPVRVSRGDLSSALDALIARCLAKDPGARPESARAVREELRGGDAQGVLHGIPFWLSRHGVGSGRRFAGFAAGGLVLALVALALGRSVWQPRLDEAVFAVHPFADRRAGSTSNYVGVALADAIVANLSSGGDLRGVAVVDSAPSGSSENSRQRRAAKLGAGRSVSGWIEGHGDSIYVSVRLTETSRGRLIYEERRAGTARDLTRIAMLAARNLTDAAGAALTRRYDHLYELEGTGVLAGSGLLQRATVALGSGTLDESLSATEQLVAAFPNEATALAVRCVALQRAVGLSRRIEYESEFLRLVHRVRLLDPASPYPDLLVGMRARFAGRYDLADSLLRIVSERVDLTPRAKAHAIRQRAYALTGLGHDSLAIAVLNEAVELDPVSSQNYATLSRALRRSGRALEAIAPGEKAVMLGPSVPDIHHTLALAYASAGRHEDAVREMRVAARLDSVPSILGDLALELLRAGERTEAVAVARLAAQFPAEAWGEYNQAAFWANYGDRRRAHAHLKTLLATGFSDVEILTDTSFAALRGDREFERACDVVRNRLGRP